MDLIVRWVKPRAQSTRDAQARKLARNFTSCLCRGQGKLRVLASMAQWGGGGGVSVMQNAAKVNRTVNTKKTRYLDL